MTQTVNTPLSYNNGIFASSVTYPDASKVGNLDIPHLADINQHRPPPVTNLGLVENFFLSNTLVKKPMFLDLIDQKQIIDVDGTTGEYKYQIAFPAKECMIVADLSNQEKPGYGGAKFKVRLNKKIGGKTSVLTFSQTSEIALYTEDYEKVGGEDDFYDYTFTIISYNSNDKYVPKEYLRPNTRIFNLTSVGTEMGRNYNELNSDDSGGGVAEFIDIIGNTHAQAHISITREAAKGTVNSQFVESYKNLNKFILTTKFAPGTIGYYNSTGTQNRVIRPIDLYKQKYGSDGAALEAMEGDVVSQELLPAIEQRLLMQVLADTEQAAMWNPGGRVRVGGEEVLMPIGLWHKMNKGNIFTYNINSFSLQLLENYLTPILKDMTLPYASDKPTITFKVGTAALELIKKLILDKYKTLPLFVNERTYVTGAGHNLILSLPDFAGYDSYPYANLRFQLETSLDGKGRGDIENPMVSTRIGSRLLSSFIIMCDDLSGLGENIMMLRKKDDWDIRLIKNVGRLGYPGFTGASSDIPNGDPQNNRGLKIFYEKNHYAYHIKDPMRCLILRPYNVNTGRGLFSSPF